MSKLQGKTAVITGGNSGIGFATARLFLQEGARVIITGRNEKAVNEAVKSLDKGASGITSDAGKIADLNTLPQKVKEISPVVDILFANAGVGLFAPFEQITEEIFDTNVNINFKGVFFTVQKLLPLIPDGGSIILNATVLTEIGLETSTAYSASKGALVPFRKTLALELAGRNIRINSISPGPVETPIYVKTGMPEDELKELAAGVLQKIPLKRFGQPEEIATAALFLASSESSFMTGADILVDGGKAVTF
jgi:NAD(P)-dependent dehydrogenase (short-subunit alcohol dehydrogenase family)